MITKTPIDTIVGINTLSWTTSDDERLARAETAASWNQLVPESGRMGGCGKPKITLDVGFVAAFSTRTGRPSTW